jgi:predicted porin
MESTYNLSGASKGMTTGMNGGSEFRLGGAEDLGNGLKADFNYAFVQDHNKGTGNPGNYNSYVGLSGEFGSIKIGSTWSPLALATWGNSAMGGAAIDTNLANGGGATAESITYNSPSIAGISLAVQGNNKTSQSTGYSVSYAIGAFSASYAANTTGTAASKTTSGIGASYDFGMAKVFLSSLSQKTAADATGYGISVPFGAATLIASGSSKGAESAYELVAKYNLSKRTLVYFQNKVLDTGTAAATTAAKTTNSVGISHAF